MYLRTQIGAKCLSSLESCDILTQFKIKKMFVTETKFLLN